MRLFFVGLVPFVHYLKGFCLVLTLTPLILAINPFRDVPADHFAYSAIEQLSEKGLLRGFEDGKFKGRRLMTRYDFAVVVAKTLAHVASLQKSIIPPDLSPEIRLLMSSLSVEFRDELDKIGVRLDTLEVNVSKAEDGLSALDKALSNIHMEGFYQGAQAYVVRGSTATVSENPGLENLNQELFLRFLGNPKNDLGFAKNIEAFVELHGRLSGVASERLDFGFSGDPLPGDGVDDFTTSISDDRRLEVSKAHFKSSASLMNLRVFKGEQFTDLRDPASLLTARVWRVNPATGLFSGVEADGKRGRWTYFTSVLKRLDRSSAAGQNPENLLEVFKKEREFSDDVFAFRTTFNPIHFEKGSRSRDLMLGATWVEHAFNYATRDDFNRIIAWDARFSSKNQALFNLTLNHLISEGRGNIHDSALKGDMQYENGQLQILFKAYDFGKDFRTSVSSSQFIDTGGDNYGRGGSVGKTGEKLLRLSARASIDEGELSVLRNLTMTLTGQTKWWEKLKGSETKDWYGRRGTKLLLRTVADFQRRDRGSTRTTADLPFQVQLENEIKKDARPDEKGRSRHSLEVGLRLAPFAGITAGLELTSDFDEVVDGQHFTRSESTLQLSGNLHKRTFFRAKLLDRTDFGGRPNEVDLDIIDLETKYDLRRNISLREFFRRQKSFASNSGNGDKVTDFWISEFNINFTPRLEGRAGYAWQESQQFVTDKNSLLKEDDFWNWFAEVKYEPNSATEVTLTYGKNFRSRFEFEPTAQQLALKAQMSF
jgi:hypothetical protein